MSGRASIHGEAGELQSFHRQIGAAEPGDALAARAQSPRLASDCRSDGPSRRDDQPFAEEVLGSRAKVLSIELDDDHEMAGGRSSRSELQGESDSGVDADALPVGVDVVRWKLIEVGEWRWPRPWRGRTRRQVIQHPEQELVEGLAPER